MRILILLALSLPLAGCFSVTGPKPVPEWAMAPQGGDAYAQPQPQRGTAVRQRAPEVAREQAEPAVGLAAAATDNRMTDAAPNALGTSNAQSGGPTRAVVRRKPTALPKDGEKPPQTDWHARDVDADRVVNSICRGC